MRLPSSKEIGTPVFITPLALSPHNAIGVQVQNFSRLWPQPFKHCYWDTCTGFSNVNNSFLLKNALPDRWPFARGRGFLGRQAERMNLCWWKGNILLEKRKPKLAGMFPDSDIAYVAPLSSRDAVRALEVLRVLKLPYVVHLWDVMDRDGLNAELAGYPELFSSAEHIFCVSSAIQEDVTRFSTTPVSLLLFTRPDGDCRATEPSGRELRIAISGHLAPYKQGLELLDSALPGLEQAFPKISIVYIGAHNECAALPKSLCRIAVKTGFVEDATRDRLLAQCHVAFLPGPLLDTSDMRARYSIPSRIADYFSAGLPTVAAVHEQSAVNLQFGTRSGFPLKRVSSSCELISALTALKDVERWRQAAQSARNCFVESMSQEAVLGHLESVIAQIRMRVEPAALLN